MSVTIYKNVSDAYNDIISGDSSKAWAVFSYDKGSDDLKVSSTGRTFILSLNSFIFFFCSTVIIYLFIFK